MRPIKVTICLEQSSLECRSKLEPNRKLLKNNGIVKSFLHIGEANLMIVSKSGDIKKWAHVLLNIKYKFFKADLKEKHKVCLMLFTHKKDLVLYFSDQKKAKMVMAMIKKNKKDILIKELTYFSNRLKILKGLLKFD